MGDTALASNTSFSASDFELISTIRVGTSTSYVTFSNIPQEYKHLQLRHIARSNGANGTGEHVELQFNGDTTLGNYYSLHYIMGDGASATSGVNSTVGTNGYSYNGRSAGSNLTSGIFGAGITDILDYNNTTKNKTIKILSGIEANGSGNIISGSALWISKSSITSISFYCSGGSGTHAQYTKISLYGVRG